jgi:hypothetical protein
MNYFFTDTYGVVHGTKNKETAQEKSGGDYIDNETVCGILGRDGQWNEGYPIYFETVKGEEIMHDVYIYTVEKQIFIDGNANSGREVMLSDLPEAIEHIALELGY